MKTFTMTISGELVKKKYSVVIWCNDIQSFRNFNIFMFTEVKMTI